MLEGPADIRKIYLGLFLDQERYTKAFILLLGRRGTFETSQECAFHISWLSLLSVKYTVATNEFHSVVLGQNI